MGDLGSCQAAEGGLVSDEIPEGDNIVGGRPADDKRILWTHLFLCHFAETCAGPHFAQMHLLFQLQAGGGSAIQITHFLGQILTSRPPESGHAGGVTATSSPELNIWACEGTTRKFCKWILGLVAAVGQLQLRAM